MQNTSLIIATMAIFGGSLLGADEHDTKEFRLFPLDKIEWKEGPPSLPPGAKIAVLEGDPSKEGPFVFRVKAPMELKEETPRSVKQKVAVREAVTWQ